MADARLTEYQKRILLVLCNAAERKIYGQPVRLICDEARGIRETTSGTALVRKGLARRCNDGRFEVTTEGYWMGDALRIEDRLGKIPARGEE